MAERALAPPLSGRTGMVAGGLLTLFGVLGSGSGVLLPPGTYLSFIETRGVPLLAFVGTAWCGLIVLLTSLVDRFDGEHASASFAEFGRIFLGIGSVCMAVAVALAATRTRYPQDLFYGFKAVPAIAIGGVVFAVIRYLIHFGQAKADRPALPAAPVKSSGTRRKRALVAVVLLCVAGWLLGQRYQEHLAHDAAEEALNREERAKAPPWNYGIDGFVAGTSEQELRGMLTGAGYRVYCPRTLTSENKLAGNDTANCWMTIRIAMGMPATVASFWFGERGMRAHMIRFEASAWGDVQRYLDRKGQRVAANFGTDQYTGGPLSGWRFDNGIVVTAAPSGNEDITVLWTPRELFAFEECSRRVRQSKGGRRQTAAVPIEKWWPGTDCGELLTKP